MLAAVEMKGILYSSFVCVWCIVIVHVDVDLDIGPLKEFCVHYSDYFWIKNLLFKFKHYFRGKIVYHSRPLISNF